VLSVSTTDPGYHSKLSERRGDKNDDHVNALGRSLFGDYLYAVELAGTLLLVATIAAILIAQEPVRRKKVAV
jgi:NADH-quinone oxidoreductase subunit J